MNQPTISPRPGPFQRDPVSEPLRIVVDASEIPSSQPADWRREFLLGFGHHPNIEVFEPGEEAEPGTLILSAPDLESDSRAVRCITDQGWIDGAIWPYQQWNVIASQLAGEATEALQPWHDDVILAQASLAARADVLVTGSTRLLQFDRAVLRDANPIALHQAIALVGLYLRSLSDFTIWQDDKGRITYNRGLFYWVGARDLLPASWRWFSACVESSKNASDEAPMMLGQSALMRIARCLRARDGVHTQMKLQQNHDTAEEAMYHLDALLLFLYGAFDAAARVCHLAMGRRKQQLNEAGWRRPDWFGQASSLVPALEPLVAPTTDGRALLDIVGSMRNSIHGEGMTTVIYQDSSVGPVETRIKLPHSEYGIFLEATRQLGGEESWGVTELLPDAAGLQPDTFVEALLPRAVRLLDALFEATPVETLPSVPGASLLTGPPQDGPFADDRTIRIRALLGFGPPVSLP